MRQYWQPYDAIKGRKGAENSKVKIGVIHVQSFNTLKVSPLANLKSWKLGFISKISRQFIITVEAPFN